MSQHTKARIAKIAGLSKPARALFERMHNGNRFYKWKGPGGSNHNGKYMEELIDAELVTSVGRVVVVERCWVPRGTEVASSVESFPRYPAEEVATFQPKRPRRAKLIKAGVIEQRIAGTQPNPIQQPKPKFPWLKK